MRVLHILHGFSMGGAETLVKDYLLCMNQMGVECKVLCFDKWYGSPLEKWVQEAGIPIVNVRDQCPSWIKHLGLIGKGIIWLKKFTGTKKEIVAWKPDVIHTHLYVNSYLYFALGKKPFYGQSGRRTVLFHTVHSEPSALWPAICGKYDSVKKTAHYYATQKLVRYQNMRFIALHGLMREELNRVFLTDNTVVLNNGIDFERFEKPRDANEVRAELHIPKDAFLLGHVGRMAEVKNHRKVVGVFKEVHKRNPNSYLLLVGDGQLEPDIRKTVLENGLENWTVFLSNRGDVPSLMNAMDVFLFPSQFEGLGIVLIEAQKAKLPCVISDTVPGHAIISNYVRVKKLTEDDAAWADAVLSPFPDSISYTNLEEWDIQRVVKKLLALYREEMMKSEGKQ